MSRILFIRGGAVGDFILTLPAIQLVRDSLPDVEIEILGYEPITALARAANLADATRSIEYGPLSSFFIPGTLLLPELMDYFKSFNVVVSHLYDPDNYFADNLERAEVQTLIRARHKVDESQSMPAATQLAESLQQLALFLEKPFVELTFNEETNQAAAAFLKTAAIPSDATLIALHPGSGSPRKNWSFEGWIDVAEKFGNAINRPLHYLVSSGEAEDRAIGEFLDLMRQRDLPVTHAAHLPLEVLGAVLQRSRLFLGHDSGISHLAAACGVPCVLVFGPTDPMIWAPQNPAVITLSAPEKDLSRLQSDEVVANALEQWQKRGED